MRAMAEDISALVGRELAQITDANLVQRINDLLVEPYPVQRPWDYGEADAHYTCWTVLEHRPSNTAITYCSQGFGPAHPWGVVVISGPDMGMGMDAQWFVSLEDAYRVSRAQTEPNPPGYEVA